MFDVCTEIGVEKVRKRKDTPKSSIAPPKVHRVVTNATSQTYGYYYMIFYIYSGVTP